MLQSYQHNQAAGQQRFTLQGHTHWITSVAYSPDGTHTVSASDDMTIRVWDATTGQCLGGPFQEHTDYVRTVAYSPDGRHIVSGSSDMTIPGAYKRDYLCCLFT